MTGPIEYQVAIKAAAAEVWQHLTTPSLMKEWMAEPEMQLEINMDPKAGGSVSIKGFHHAWFRNEGTVLHFEPEHELQYDYLSSLSGLPDRPENRTRIHFSLQGTDEGTKLILTLSNFPDEAIFRHVRFYWKNTLVILKEQIETRSLQ